MERILVLRLGAMGDIVLATAAVEALKAGRPGASVEFLLKKRFSGLLEGHPGLKRLWGFDERGEHGGARGLVRFLGDIRRERFDLAVDLQDNLRSRLICRGLKAGRVLRWDKRAWQRRLMVAGKKGGAEGMPVYARYLEALRPLGMDVSGARPKLYPNSAKVPAGLGEHFLAMAPGAHWPAKRWPAESYAELARIVLERTGLGIALVGAGDDREACALISRVGPKRIADLCGRLDLGSLAAVLAEAEALATNDTGPMHVAEAVGTPVLAFFGPTVPGFGFAPWRQESRLLQLDLDCRPCSLHGRRDCPRGGHRCLDGITPERAWEALKGMLDG